MKRITTIIAIGSLLVFSSCKKKYDTPPIEDIPATGSITIDSLRNWQASTGGTFRIEDEISVHGIVTMDEGDGNIYKNFFLQDATGAINVRTNTGGGIYLGDSVRIYLKGTTLGQYNGLLQLDSVHVDNNIEKLAIQKNIEPEVITIDQITTLRESQVIKIENVQFIYPEVGETFADKENLESMDRILEDCFGYQVIVRSSGYASFADQPIPSGNGSITCIVSHFNGDIQLYIRSFSEIAMDGARCAGTIFIKNFDDGSITSNGWTNYNVSGSIDWYTDNAGGAPTDYGVISNYADFTNYECETWLISPSIDLTPFSSPVLNFQNAYNYSGNALELYISTDYDGSSNPTTQGTWTALTANWSTGGFAWVNSGDIDLSSYISSNVYIGFKYTGSMSDGSTWELDDIRIIG